MSRSRVAAIVLRILYLYRGSPQRVLPIFVWVVVDIVLWGFITRYLNSVAQAEVNFVPLLLGAVLLWDFLTRVMQGVTMAFFEDVWSRNFLNYFATPLRTSEYLTGLVLAAVGTSMISLIVMLAFARAAFGLSFLAYGVALAPFLAVLFLTGIALGVAAAGLGAAFGAGVGMAHLADPDARLAIRRSVLSGDDPARMDAGDRGSPAAVLCLRRHARGRRRRAPAVGSASARRRPGDDLSLSRVPVLRVGLSHRDPHRPHRPLQRRDDGLRCGRRLALTRGAGRTRRARSRNLIMALAPTQGNVNTRISDNFMTQSAGEALAKSRWTGRRQCTTVIFDPGDFKH